MYLKLTEECSFFNPILTIFATSPFSHNLCNSNIIILILRKSQHQFYQRTRFGFIVKKIRDDFEYTIRSRVVCLPASTLKLIVFRFACNEFDCISTTFALMQTRHITRRRGKDSRAMTHIRRHPSPPRFPSANAIAGISGVARDYNVVYCAARLDQRDYMRRTEENLRWLYLGCSTDERPYAIVPHRDAY